ncbi:hypothetical protein ACIRL0_15995 [Streptomyces sp. NPDC102365]|uniref:hypothetical protein n=1 Tax=Streptomyces sp. NPDC102365 TaxID=3366162 RepID=UPI0037F5963C
MPTHQLPKPPTPPAPLALPPDAPRAGILHLRYRHTERYTVVGNHLAQHPRLSAVAIGFGVYIQSLPDGAPVTVKALTLRFLEGEVTVAKALRELEREGYLVRQRVPAGPVGTADPVGPADSAARPPRHVCRAPSSLLAR